MDYSENSDHLRPIYLKVFAAGESFFCTELITEYVCNRAAIAEPSSWAVLEIKAIGREIRLGECEDVVVVAIVGEGVAQYEHGWHHLSPGYDNNIGHSHQPKYNSTPNTTSSCLDRLRHFNPPVQWKLPDTTSRN